MQSSLIVTMLDILKSIKERGVPGKILDAIKTDKPRELCMLLSKNKVKKQIRKTDGKVLCDYLYMAICHGYFRCMEELLKAGAYPNAMGWCYPLTRIITAGEVNLLKMLLDYGANPDCSQEVPLHISARRAELGMFRMLLLYGADPNYNGSDSDSYTDIPHSVLWMCIANNYEVQFVELLILFGANMYLPDIHVFPIQADNDAAKHLDRERVHPRSLMSQCRIAIRRRLKQVGKLRLLDQLEIPANLVRYLQYHNELDYPEKLPRYYDIVQYICTIGP
ncbi:ankyrin repeat and SOCS box protein 12-like [Leptodactylus fuscus]|uniref:ankyrin repeat and SOCS box protein 12-like n=1 Tax=Leptodactylus fuscus TaxID=238119 RepID=UPI003F4E8FFD